MKFYRWLRSEILGRECECDRSLALYHSLNRHRKNAHSFRTHVNNIILSLLMEDFIIICKVFKI